MSATVQEAPPIYFADGKPICFGPAKDLETSYFEIKVFLPDIIRGPSEMTDAEVIAVAEDLGTWDFLHSDEEDSYSAKG